MLAIASCAPLKVLGASAFENVQRAQRAQAGATSSYRAVIERAAQEGIGVLSPTQSMPVEPLAEVPYQELSLDPLPFDPLPCDMRPSEGLTDASVLTDGQSPSDNQTPPKSAGNGDSELSSVSALESGSTTPQEPDGTQVADAQPAPLPVECAHVFPDVSPTPPQTYSFGLETSDAGLHEPVVIVTQTRSTTHAWFSTVGSQYGFSYNGGGWTYRDTVGPTVALGNLTANAPVWGSTAPIGGLQLSSGWNAQSEVLSQGDLAFSSSVGRLNYTDTSASAGAIDYGATAGSGSFRYGLTPALTVESQVQTAPDMATRGLGTTYAAGDIGTFRLGVTRSEFDQSDAWRYRLGYSVNLSESISLAVTNEQIDAGFGDLSVYRNGAAASPTMRNTIAAGVPLRGGTLTGTYTGTRESGIAVEQRFGLEHSRFVAPGVRLALGADRDVVTGDYEMRAGITMPVDTFMRGRWLHW
ncbi:fimbrial protein [Bordetella sp. 15P40C-2]|uniref:fimbrial protein n=1 Tax=Bordetella sp. 15P40C-2 TaxID=2572246 RepID=UPI00351BD5A9